MTKGKILPVAATVITLTVLGSGLMTNLQAEAKEKISGLSRVTVCDVNSYASEGFGPQGSGAEDSLHTVKGGVRTKERCEKLALKAAEKLCRQYRRGPAGAYGGYHGVFYAATIGEHGNVEFPSNGFGQGFGCNDLGG